MDHRKIPVSMLLKKPSAVYLSEGFTHSLLAAGKIAPALVTGNTMVIKPSPFIPAGDLKLVKLAQ